MLRPAENSVDWELFRVVTKALGLITQRSSCVGRLVSAGVHSGGNVSVQMTTFLSFMWPLERWQPHTDQIFAVLTLEALFHAKSVCPEQQPAG